jgi:hypothetical protein
MKNTIIITALLLTLIWGCSDEEVVEEAPSSWYIITCYSSSGIEVMKSDSLEHPKLGTVSKYAWKSLDGTSHQTNMRCTATLHKEIK